MRYRIGMKDDKRIFKWFILFLFFILIVPILLLLGMYFFLNADTLTIGMTGFMQKVLVRGGFGFIAAVIAAVCIVTSFRAGTTKRQRIVKWMIALIAIPLSIFFIRPLILDIPYLHSPMRTYLERLDFHESYGYGDAMTTYYLRAIDISGERQSFRISKKRFDEGREQDSKNDYRLFAEISYLPHTSTLMTLRYISNPDFSPETAYPASASLPEHKDSFSLQINDEVYKLPTPITTFLDDGWIVSEEDAGMNLAGPSRSDISYEWEWITLTNDRQQEISVCAFNTTAKAISVEESTVGSIHVLYGNYDFGGTELRIPGGGMLGWSTEDEIIAQFGETEDCFDSSNGDSILTYRNGDPSFPGYWRLEFDERGILRDVMVHHQAYRTSTSYNARTVPSSRMFNQICTEQPPAHGWLFSRENNNNVKCYRLHYSFDLQDNHQNNHTQI